MTDPLVALVDKATSEYLVQTDWTVVLQICDSLNRENNPLGCRDVLRQATKKMKEKKTRVAMYALELIETLVKNCECMHSYVGGKEFQAELIKLIQNKKTKDAVRNRALELVQYWADSFQTRRDLPLFNQTHLLLRRSGITFPARRTDEPPLVFKNVPPSHDRRDHRITPPRQDSTSAGLKDFSALQENVNLAMEMLAYTNPEEEDPSTNEILKDLINTCKEAAPNVRSAIEGGPSESQMVTLLALNDELMKVQEMFDDLVARRQLFLKHGPQPKKPAPGPGPAASPNFIDLADAFGPLSLSGPQQPQHHHTNTHATTTSSNPLGDLDFLSLPASQPLPPSNTGYATQPVVIGYTSSTGSNTGYTSFPAPPAQQPYITTIQQPTTSYPPQPQGNYISPTKTPVAATQPGSYVNPFLDTTPAQPAPARQGGGSADPFDEFDMLASSRHPAPAPVPLATPLQPTPSAKPAPQTPPSLYFPPANPTPSANIPLVPAPANGLYMNTTGPRATSPMNPLYPSSAPLATSPTNNPYGYPQTGPGVGMGTNPYLSTYPAGQPMQPLQPIQPMQPMQPNYTPYPAYNPLQAGGYRPQ
eukprot:Phypoly_transcript_04942.p1 GENE.Phypoly_transcript_04942~~Phypoly_transcript_04942.p1  ORF type:complete len:589 (+),score=123.26 Phypoly_transcript_04942:101-1867(+)